MAKLIVFDSNGRSEVELAEHNTLGRHPQNRIQVLDRMVSKEHCLVFQDKNKKFKAKDLESLNGTFYNKEPLTTEVFLKDGDEISLGSTRCMFIDELSTESAANMVDLTESEISVKSHIRKKITSSMDLRFVPEKEIDDEKVLRLDYEKLRVAHELQSDIGSELDIEKIINKILDKTFEFLNCDRGVILLEDDDGELKPRAYRNKKKNEKLVLSSTLINQVRKEKAGILSSDASMDNRFKEAHSIIMQGIRSSMAVPIMHESNLYGILIIDSSVAVNAYSEKDLRLLSNIARQTAQFIINSEMAKKIEKDAGTREQFSKLLSPDLAEMVVSGELKVEKGGENRTATVLFADIRGFTSMSENMEASEVLQMLNEYFEVLVEIVFKHEGTVDKFVGDEIMVIWGAPVRHSDDASRAVKTAIDMQSALVEFNETRRSEGQSPIHIGIGVNTGELVAGYIGSTRTMSYSVIGDTVNTAARLCSAAKPAQILISDETHKLAGSGFDMEKLEPITVKGKVKPVKIYNVKGFA